MSDLPRLIIAGIALPNEPWCAWQEYRALDGGSTVHRMLNGAALKQTHWRRLVTTIRGDGWAPPALDAVDWSQPVEIACIQPRAASGATVSAVLPSARRADVAPLAYAVVGVGLVATPLASLVGDTATATAVPGAAAYKFLYWPKLDFVSDGPVVALDAERGIYGWTLDAEEA